jgi:hypothetical protein
MQSMMTILEDRRGEAVKIALYNVLGLQSDHWRECFPKGITIGIIEPFLKQFAEATVGIRVDDPLDIVYFTPICVRLGCGIAKTKNFDLKVCLRCRQAKYCSPRCPLVICSKHKTDFLRTRNWTGTMVTKRCATLLLLHPYPRLSHDLRQLLLKAWSSGFHGAATFGASNECSHCKVAHARQDLQDPCGREHA